MPDRKGFEPFQIGANISFATEVKRSSTGVRSLYVAGIGDTAEAWQCCNGFREALYGLSLSKLQRKNMKWLDLGQIKGGDLGVAEVCELVQAIPDALLLLVDGTSSKGNGQLSGFERWSGELLLLAELNNRVSAPTLLDHKPIKALPCDKKLLQLAYQGHFCDPELLETLSDHGNEIIRLGAFRDQPEEVEPLLRPSHGLWVHLSALRHSEVAGVKGCAPSGLHIEEACKFGRYAGLSQELRSVGMYGLSGECLSGPAPMTAALIAYYLAEGFSVRFQERPGIDMVQFVLELTAVSLRLEFVHSPRTDRWWCRDISHSKPKEFVPCSYVSFNTARQGELSEALEKALY